jgi:hypothetical protein
MHSAIGQAWNLRLHALVQSAIEVAASREFRRELLRMIERRSSRCWRRGNFENVPSRPAKRGSTVGRDRVPLAGARPMARAVSRQTPARLPWSSGLLALRNRVGDASIVPIAGARPWRCHDGGRRGSASRTITTRELKYSRSRGRRRGFLGAWRYSRDAEGKRSGPTKPG